MLGTFTLSQAFNSCYYGSQIKSITNSYSSSIDYGKWIMTESKKDMLILQEVLKKPANLRAGGWINIDLETFLKIVKSAYSLFTFFKR
jgi:7tm Odorant receptor